MDGGSAASIHTLAQHGGRLSAAHSLYPDAPRPWIDLSTGINPHAYRAPRSTVADRARLPDPLRVAELQTIAAVAFAVADYRRIVPTPGTELALRLLPTAIGAKAAAIATPTYSSHADAWARAGAKVSELPLSAIHAASPHDVIVIVNPNNPDGALLSRPRLLELHDALHARGAWLVIDEAFVDVDPVHSICDLAGTSRAPNLIALRSFGKFYGLAGVRLGFAVGCEHIAGRMRGLIGDWPLSSDALAAGIAAYADHEWARKMRAHLQDKAQQLDELLLRHGLSIMGGTTLFRLARHTDAPRLLQRLLSAGILVRPFAHDATLLRFGLPGAAVAWRRLCVALRTS